MINNQSSIINKLGVVFFGSGPYVSPIIDILNKNFDLKLVVTTEKDPSDPVPIFCSKNKIKYISVVNLSSQSFISQLSSLNCRLAVLAYFGLMIPGKILNIFPLGIINIHPSLLPRYRGPTPVQGAILAGDKITGASIIKLDNKVDHGPILVSIDQSIDTFDTSESLYRKLFKKGADLLIEVLPKYISGELKPVEQDDSKATFTDRLTRETGRIDLDNGPTKEQLDRMIRAYYPWPGVWFKTKLNNVERIVKLFPGGKIQVEGKKIMQLRDFQNGYPDGRQILSKLSLSF